MDFVVVAAVAVVVVVVIVHQRIGIAHIRLHVNFILINDDIQFCIYLLVVATGGGCRRCAVAAESKYISITINRQLIVIKKKLIIRNDRAVV